MGVAVADGRQAIEQIRADFPDALVQAGEFRGQHWAELRPNGLVEVCRWLRDDPSMAYELLLDVTAAHWPDEPKPFEIIVTVSGLPLSSIRCTHTPPWFPCTPPAGFCFGLPTATSTTPFPSRSPTAAVDAPYRSPKFGLKGRTISEWDRTVPPPLSFL